jgi:hypothetical protein
MLGAQIIESERASAIVGIDTSVEKELDLLLRSGWRYSPEGPAPEVLTWSYNRGGVTLWPVGAFDDRECGVVAFTSEAMAHRLAGRVV